MLDDKQFGKIKTFENIIVGPSGIVLSENGEYIEGANLHYDHWNDYAVKYKWNNGLYVKDIISKYNKDKIHVVSEPSILCVSYFNSYLFGHILDNIQSLKPVFNNPQYSDYKLICNEKSDHIKNIDFHFSIFGFPESRRRHICNKNTFFKFKNIIIPQLATHLAYIDGSCFRWLVDTYLSNIKLQKPQYKTIYTSRGCNPRSAINEEEVRKFCDDNNIKIVDGSEPFDEIVSYFYHAEFIFGPHGSMQKHCMFNSKKAKVIEFQPHNRGDNAQKQNSSFSGVDYEIIKIQADKQFRIMIPLDVVKRYIK